MKKIGIIGGGVSGLVAAFLLEIKFNLPIKSVKILL